MATITTRAGKGSPLTNTEVDDNFSNLNSAKYESGSAVTFDSGNFYKSQNTLTDVAIHNPLVNTGGSQGASLSLISGKHGSPYTFWTRLAQEADARLVIRKENVGEILAIEQGGNFVYNEASYDIDFRVESNDNAHMLFVDGAENTVGIGGQADSTTTLHVYNTKAVLGLFAGDNRLTARFQTHVGNDSKLDFLALREEDDPAPYDWTSSATRIQQVIDTTKMGYIQFNGSGGRHYSTSIGSGGGSTYQHAKENILFSSNGVHVNRLGMDRNFRVETENNSNMLFIDGENDAVGIGKEPNASYALDVNGQILQNGSTVSGIVYNYSTSVVRPLNDPARWYKIYSYAGASSRIVKLRLHHGGDNTHFEGEFTVTLAGYGFKHSIHCENYQYYNGPQILEIATRIVSNTTTEIWVRTDPLTAYAGTFAVYANDSNIITPAAASAPTGLNTRLGGAHFPGTSSRPSMSVSNDIHIANESKLSVFRSDDARSGSLFHNNSGTVLRTNHNGDNLYLQTGGTGNINIQPTQAGYSTIINDDSSDVDFRVESNSNDHMLYVDGTENRVGIAKSNPAHALDVNGQIVGQNSGDKRYYSKYISPRNASDGTYAGYLLLVPVHNGGDPENIRFLSGEFLAFRGNTGSGNSNSRCKVQVSTAWTTTTAQWQRSFSSTGTYFSAMCVVTYNGDDYVALKFNSGGGGPNHGIYFSGTVNREADDAFFMARDNEVTVVDANYGVNTYNTVVAAGSNSGSFTVNDSGKDVDFRVESSGNSHALFVDAAANTTTFGTASIDPVADNAGGASISAAYRRFHSNTAESALAVGTNNSKAIALFHHNGTSATERGAITVSTTGTTYSTTSDRRLKRDIETITDGTDKLMAMNPVTHGWKADPEADTVHGFIAQEMMDIVPEAVSGDPEGEEMMSMDYGRITPVLVAALQDAHKKIAELEARLNTLEGK
jgi:hypothetical protein